MAKKKLCKKCKSRLEDLIVKSLKLNVPDGVRGRDICPHCGKGCVAYDVPIFHNDGERLKYSKTDEQKYGLCCNCGKRGDSRLWVKPTEKSSTSRNPSHEEMLLEYMDATPDAIAFATGFLGKDPFEEDNLKKRIKDVFAGKPEVCHMSMKEINAEIKAYRKEQAEKKKEK